ncbi:MAG: putative HNHc nuclease [Mitsuokella sp.]
MLTTGTLAKETEKGFWLFVPVSSEREREEIRRAARVAAVEFSDARTITAGQRKKAYVLIRYIAEWWSDTPAECMKELSKLMFREVEPSIEREPFSLSDCDRTTARLYITYLIEFCLLNDVPCGEPMYKLAEDLPKYTWACLMKKRCVVCGRKAELHHCNGSVVGMGRNRKEICHIGMRALPLCREHHTEIHRIGQEDFLKRYIIEPVRIDERIAKVYRLKER